MQVLSTCRFNSIKVQLELFAVVVSIEIDMFQFHKGAIRTALAQMFSSERVSFNSIKVQLEPILQAIMKVENISFNSIKVQLELALKRYLLT